MQQLTGSEEQQKAARNRPKKQVYRKTANSGR